MQNIALILLLAVTASMIFSFDAQILAQETPVPSDEGTVEEETSEETTEEETMEEEMMEDTMEEVEDEMSEEEMMEDTMEEVVDSPLGQMTSGVAPHEIQCKAGQSLVFKASNWRPACVNDSSIEILSMRGWVANHDPSHEELTKMQDDYMAEHAEEETEEEVMEEIEEETEEEIEIEEDIVMEDETTGNGTETEGQVEQQSYTVNLSENMEMGVQ